ncbi:hypothetical protein [Pseudoxanthomonas mexicana]|uniref:hypothetical protein n=1 Tax=Pseudoxanthomonas mexicana TaxID=128785 RepID=UPI00398BB962
MSGGHDTDDYLWDRSGPVDEEIAALERALAPLSLRAMPPRATAGRAWTAEPRRPRRRLRRALAALAAALLLGLGIGGWHQHRLAWPEAQPWRISQVRGQVNLDGQARPALSALRPGAVLETAEGASVRMRAARIGEVVVGERSRFRIVRTASGRHRTELQQGSLWARVWAPPGAFGVATPMGEVYDLGCEFVLRAGTDGSGSLSVRSGWVQLDNGWQEVLVPQGARVEIHAGGRPGTPYDLRSSAAFRAALHRIDAADAAIAADDPRVRELVAAARPHDALSLLSLLHARPQLLDGPVFDRLSELMPADALVTRAQVRTQGLNAYGAWWDRLPYPRMKRWWLHWPDAIGVRADADALLSGDRR